MESKKISELEQYTGSADGFMVPGVADGETKKADLGTLVENKATAAGFLKPSGLKTINGVSIAGQGDIGLEMANPFKGWFKTGDTLPATGGTGDYLYFKDTEASPVVTTIYRWNGTAFENTNTEVDESNVQTLGSGQEVNAVKIKDASGQEVTGPAGVLSAEAGRTIAETTMELETGLNILNPADIKVGKRIASNGGEYNVSSTNTPEIFGCTDYIEIGDGVICNHTIKYIGTYYRGAAIYDSQKRFIGTKSAVDFGNSLIITKDISSFNDKSEEGADSNDLTYVRFNLYDPAAVEGGVAYDGETDGYAVYRATELPTPAFQPYHAPYWKQKAAPIQNGAVTTAKIKDGAVTPQKTSFFKNVIVSNNILDPNTVKYGVYVNINTGLESNSTMYCTDFISIDEKGLYINHAAARSGVSDGGCVIYNSSKGYIRSRSASSSGNSLAISYEDGAAYVRFNIPNANTIDTVYVCRGTQPLPDGYEPYEEQLCVDPDYISTKGLVSADEIVKAAADAGIYSDEVEVVLPNKFYAVVGDTLQLFYQGMVIAPDFRIYDIYAKDTAIGKGYGRYFEATPNSAGTSTFSLEVSNQNMRLLGSKTCQIVAVNPPSNPATNKNILCIGDSLTAGGKWVCELQRRLKASDGTPQGLGLTNITFVGSMSKTLYGQTADFYGKSGWGWSDFCTVGRAAFRFHITSPDGVSEGNVYKNNSHTYTVVEINNVGEGTGTDDWTILCTTSSASNTPQSSGSLTLTSGSGGNVVFTSAEADGANLLWDSTNNRINFKKYCTVNAGMTNEENLDYLMLLLTWNQLPSSDDISDWSEIIGYIEDMLDAIHTDYPTCKVKMMGVQFPYIESFVAATNNQHTFATIRRIAFVNKLYQEICNREEYSDYVEFVNISAQFDSQYNMDLITSGGQTREKDVNTRNSHFKEMFVGNTVHPGTTGYMQIADAAYRVMCAALQGEDN